MLLLAPHNGAVALPMRRAQSYVEISNYMRGIARQPLRSHLNSRPSSTCPMRVQRKFHSCRVLHETVSSKSPLSADAVPPALAGYVSTFNFPQASTQFRALIENPVPGQEVVLHGYLGRRTDMGKKMTFVRVFDPMLQFNIQVIAFAKNEVFHKLRDIEPHSPVAIKGIVQNKAIKGNIDEVPKADQIEIALKEIDCLNEFPRDIIMTSDTVFPPEKRYLQLRTDNSLRDSLRFRADVRNAFRDALEELDPPFVEIETPILFKSTPEGAREFLVPTRRKGLAYALPQSPQQYKQILMASGIPRYYQFARCFRDEDLRADRQPEFTQLDLEMSFARGEDVMIVMENIMKKIWKEFMREPLSDTQFPRMTYEQVMSKYGSDKPDIRIGMEIQRIDDFIPSDLISKITDLENPIVEAIKIEGSEEADETRNLLNSFMDSPVGTTYMNNPDGGPGTFVYDARRPVSGLGAFGYEATWTMEERFGLEQGDLVIIQARPNAPHSGGSTALGNIRRDFHKAAVDSGFKPAPTSSSFLWVHQFPLFSPSTDDEPGQGGAAGISATHHPFTAPYRPEDISLLFTNPSAAVADHYDLVVNGVELGGGSRRIHSATMQEFVLRDVLRMPEARLADFGHLLEALRAGCPPHAGIALGFDRLIAVMRGRESVRDVMAFPKSGKGEDMMVRCPSEISREALETYHLRLRD